MRDMYDSFLQRLIKSRQEIHLTQEEISDELGIDQSQLSKMELGKTIYSYKILQRLCASKWDMDYILIGKKYDCEESEIGHMITETSSEDQKDMLQLAVWALVQGIKKSDVTLDEERRFEVELLHHRAYETELRSLLYQIRGILGMAQQTMSEKLGVNIKKYRMLEREEINPDAELLLRIYEGTGCRPSLFLEPEKIDRIIADDLWKLIKPSIQAEIIALLKQGISVLNS